MKAERIRIIIDIELYEPLDPRIFRDVALAAVDREIMQIGGRSVARYEANELSKLS